MDVQSHALLLEHDWIGSKVKVTVRWQGSPVHMDTLDPANAAHRQRFIKALKDKLPQADSKTVDGELLRIADMPSNQPQTAGPVEVNVTRIVRPEMFHVPEVSGLTVPEVGLVEGKPAGQWKHYLRWADGKRECRDLAGFIDLPDNGRLYVHPIPGEPAVNTASGWSAAARRAWLDGADFSDSADLFRGICERIAYFIDLPQDVAAGMTATAALWTIMSYCFQTWDAVPYLYVGGPIGSGKSTLFSILARLVFRPLQSSNLTAPALFRTLNDRGGAVLFDEAERLRQSTSEVQEIMSMLLAGYKRGGQAIRLEAVGDTFRPVAFDVYGPKALACIAGLPPALASRCITMMMFRAGPGSPKPKRRIDADPAGWQSLRDDLHVLALEHGATWLNLAQRSAVCTKGIDGRAYELWQPLLALAGWIESHGAAGLLDLVQRHALTTIDAGKDDAVPEADEVLLEILTEEVQDGQWPSPGEILAKAQDRDPNTFGKPTGSGPRWQPATVTRRLKSYGIPVPRKSNGQRRYREVTLGMLWRIQRSYGIDLNIEDPAPSPQEPTLIDPSDPAPVGCNGNSRVSEGQ